MEWESGGTSEHLPSSEAVYNLVTFHQNVTSKVTAKCGARRRGYSAPAGTGSCDKGWGAAGGLRPGRCRFRSRGPTEMVDGSVTRTQPPPGGADQRSVHQRLGIPNGIGNIGAGGKAGGDGRRHGAAGAVIVGSVDPAG